MHPQPWDQDANVAITLFFTDREPVGPYRVVVPARRTRHLRFDIDDPEPVPRDTPYSSVIESDVPIVVQHSRLDSARPSKPAEHRRLFAGLTGGGAEPPDAMS